MKNNSILKVVKRENYGKKPIFCPYGSSNNSAIGSSSGSTAWLKRKSKPYRTPVRKSTTTDHLGRRVVTYLRPKIAKLLPKPFHKTGKPDRSRK